MRTLRTIWSKFRSVWQRTAVKREIDEELRLHLELRTAENIAAGMSPARVRPGFDTQNILTMSVMTDYDQITQPDFHERALERIAALPGVRNAAFVWGLPLTGNKWVNDGITIAGQPDPTKLTDKLPVAVFSVTPAYVDALGLHLSVADMGTDSTCRPDTAGCVNGRPHPPQPFSAGPPDRTPPGPFSASTIAQDRVE